MPSPVHAVLDAIDADRRALHAAVARVPDHLRATRPSPDRWSVAEVLDHLATVEARIAGVFGQLAAAAPPRDPAAPGVAPEARDRALLLDRRRALSAPEFIQPRPGADAADALERLERSRAQLRATLEATADRDLTVVTRSHPVLGELDGYRWLASLGGHEARHAAQIEEIAEQLGEGEGESR